MSDAARRRAEADYESALMAVAMATDTAGRRIMLLRTPYRGWQPDAAGVTAADIRKQLLDFHSRVAEQDVVIIPEDGCSQSETELRVIHNTRLLLNAWEAAVRYEMLK